METLESRVVPASSISITDSSVFGSGSLDAALADGIISVGEVNAAPGSVATLSRAALQGVSSVTDISINSPTDIIFNSLSSTLVLQTGGGHGATFTAGASGAGSIAFSTVANQLSTTGGGLIFQATNLAGGMLSLGSLSAASFSASATGDIGVTSITANGGITLTSTQGRVGSTGTLQTSSQLTLTSATGIGVQSSAVTLQATNSTSGNIVVLQTAAPAQLLTITDTAGGVVNSAPGGAIFINNLGSGIQLGTTAPVSSNNGNITLAARDLIIDSSASINAGTGVVTLANSVAGDTIDLGTNSIPDIGLTQAELNTVTGKLLRIGSSTAGPIQISASIVAQANFGNTLTLINNDAITEAAGVSLTATKLRVASTGPVTLDQVNDVANLASSTTGSFLLNNGTNTLTIPSAGVDGALGVTTTNSNVTLKADNILIQQIITPGTGTVFLEPFTTTLPITLGTASVAGVSFGLTNGNLGWITSGVTEVGSFLDSGGIAITAAINRTPTATAPSRSQTLVLVNDNAITQTASLSVANFDPETNGSVTLTTAGNDVDTLSGFAGSSGSFSFTDVDDLTIDQVASDTQLHADQNITITTGGALTINESVSSPIGNSALTILNVGGAATEGANGTVIAANLQLLGTGPYTLDNTGNDVNNIAANVTNAVTYTDANALNITTVNGTIGITTDGADIAIATVDGDLTVSNSVNATGGSVALTAGGAGSELFNNSSILGDGVTLTADRMRIQPGSISAGGGTATLQPFSAGQFINLGSFSNSTPGTLELRTDEINSISNAAVIVIGNATAGDITISRAINPSGTNQLELVTGGGILDGHNSATSDITVTRLGMTAVTGIGTVGSPNGTIETTVSNLEATTVTGGIDIDNTGAVLSIGGVNNTLQGVKVTGATGYISIVNDNNINVILNGENVAGPDAVTLDSTSGDIVLGGNNGAGFDQPSGAVASTNGDVTLTAESGNLYIGDIITTTYGDIEGGGSIFLNASGNININDNSLVSAHGAGVITANAGGDISLLATDPPFFAASLSTEGGDITLTTGAGGTVTLDSSASAHIPGTLFTTRNGGNGNVFINADNLSISFGDSIDAGTGVVAIDTITKSRDITVGTVPGGTLGISQIELDRITAGILRIGSSADSGALTVTDDIAGSPTTWETLTLANGGGNGPTAITEAAGKTVTVDSLALNAGNGIDFSTATNAVKNLAFFTANGNVVFENTGGLTIAAVDTLLTSSSAGTTDLTAHSPITFAVDTTSVGTLTADAIHSNPIPSPDVDDDITVNAGVTVESTTGDVIFNAGDSIITAAGSTIKSDTGAITLQIGLGDIDHDASFQLGGSLVASVINFIAQDTIYLDDLNLGTGAYAGDTISVTVTNGKILDSHDNPGEGGDDSDLGDDIDVLAANLALSADKGIGNNGVAIITQVGGLVAQTVTSGGIFISNNGDLTIGYGASPFNGVSTGAGGGDIAIATVAGDLTVSGKNDVTATGGSATLTAGGSGKELINDASINGVDVTLTADRMRIQYGSIDGGAGDVILQQYTDGWFINLGSFSNSTAGTLELRNDEINTISNANLIQIGNSNAGDLTLSRHITPSGTSHLELVTGGQIVDGHGGYDITVANLGLTAGTGIGVSGSDAPYLDVVVGNLEATTTSGGISINGQNGYTIGNVNASLSGVTAAGGDISLEGDGTITVAEGVANTGGGNITLSTYGSGGIIVNGAVAATTGDGNVVLQAVDSINVNAPVSTVGAGTIAAAADFDDNSNGDFTSDAAGTLDTQGGDITVLGGSTGLHGDLATFGGAVTIAGGKGAITVSVGRHVEVDAAFKVTGSGGIFIISDSNNNNSGHFVSTTGGTLDTDGGDITIMGGTDGQHGSNATIGDAITITGGAGSVTISYGTSITVNAPVDVTGKGAISATADSDASGSGTFTNIAAGTLDTAGGLITITAADASLGGTIDATSAAGTRVIIQPSTTGAVIHLGTDTAFGLTDAEVDLVTANILQIGNTSFTGGIQFTGLVTVDPANVPVLSLETAGGMRDNTAGGAVFLTAESLALRAATGIGSKFNDLDISVSNLAAINTASGNINIQNTGALTLARGVDGLSGITEQAAGFIAITTGSPMFIDSIVSNTGGGDITLSTTGAGGDITQTPFGSVLATGGSGNILIDASNAASGGAIDIQQRSPVVVSVANDGFEVPNQGVGFSYNPAGGSWTFSLIPSGGSGIASNFSAFTPVNATNGNSDGATSSFGQAAFIQRGDGSLANGTGAFVSQALDFGAGGIFTISFDLEQRGGYGINPIQVLLDGQDLGTYTPSSSSSFNTFTIPNLIVTPGVHTLAFVGTGGNATDNDTFLDNVSVTQLPSILNSGTGNITLLAKAAATIEAGVNILATDGGSITIHANENDANATNDITVGAGAAIKATGSLTTSDVNFSADPDQNCVGGTVTIDATADVYADHDINIRAAKDVTLTVLTAVNQIDVHSCSNILDDSVDSTYISANHIVLDAGGRIGGTNVIQVGDVLSADPAHGPTTSRYLQAIDFDFTGTSPSLTITQGAAGGNVQLRKVNSGLTIGGPGGATLDLSGAVIGPVNQFALISSGGDFKIQTTISPPTNTDFLTATTNGYNVVFSGAPSAGALVNGTPGSATTTVIASGSPSAAIVELANDDSPEVSGANIHLYTTGGDIGSSALPLEINALQLDGFTNGNGAAGGSAFLTDVANGVSFGQFNAGTGNFTLHSIGNTGTGTNITAATPNDGIPEIIGNVVTLDVTSPTTGTTAPSTGNSGQIGSFNVTGQFFEVQAKHIFATTNDSRAWISAIGGSTIGLVDVGTNTAFLKTVNGNLLSSSGTDVNAGAAVNLTGINGGFGTPASPIQINSPILTAAVTSGAGDINVKGLQAGGLTVTKAQTVSGNVSLGALGAMQVGAAGGTANVVSATGTVFLDSDTPGGNITLGTMSSAAPVVSAGGDVTMFATGNIVNNAPVGILDVDAQGLGIVADGAVGAVGTPITTSVDTLAGRSGNDFIVSNTGDLILGDVSTVLGINGLGGDVDIRTTGSMTIDDFVFGSASVDLLAIEAAGPGQDIIVNNSVTSNGGGVRLRAGDNVVVSNGALVNGATTTDLGLGFNDMDGTGGGTIRGTVGHSGGTTPTATGGSGDDTLLVDFAGGASLPAGLAYTGGAGSNELDISDAGVATARTYTLDATTVARSGTSIGIDGTIAKVDVEAGSLADTFNVTPSTTAAFDVHGNNPTTAPGDTLNVNTTGTTTPFLSVSGTVPPGLSGDYTFGNRQTVSFDTIENLQPASNFITVTKTDTPASTTAIPGTSITYTVTVTNNSGLGITGISLADTMPAGLNGATWSAVFSSGSSGTTSGSGDIDESIDLASGGSATYTVTGTIDPTASGSLSNTATGSLPTGLTDTNPADNSATDTDTLVPTVNVVVTKTDGLGVTTATPGTTTTYTITVSNVGGPSTVSSMEFKDLFPAAITSATWTSVTAGGATGNTASGSGSIDDFVTLPANSTITYTVIASISPAATGTLVNTATATLPLGVTDSAPGNESATDTDTLTPSADVKVTLNAPATGVVGTALTYSYTVTNVGPSIATATSFTTTLPANATIISVTSTQGPVVNTLGVVTNTIGTLLPGASATITITLNPIKKGVFSLSGTGTSAVADPTPVNDTATGSIAIAPYESVIVGGPGAGGGPQVRVVDATTGNLIRTFDPFGPNWQSSIDVAQGDINGDGVPEIIIGSGPGGAPQVIVYDLRTGAQLASFYAYDAAFRSGVNVAVGDVNGDGYGDIITGAGTTGGGPHVKAFSGKDVAVVLDSFYAYDPNFDGGVRVAAGDIDGDGKAEIITGAGGGGSSNVKVWNAASPIIPLYSFFAYDSGLRDGVFVAVGDVIGDGREEVITGAGGGGSSHVKVFQLPDDVNPIRSFFAFPPDARDGVSVGANDFNDDGKADIVAGTGVGVPAQIKLFNPTTSQEEKDYSLFDAGYTGGVYVG